MCDRVTVCARVSRRRRAVLGACPVLRWWTTGRRALHDNTEIEDRVLGLHRVV